MKLRIRILQTAVAIACPILLMTGASSTVRAQQAAGSITGTVEDSSGSALPDAKITVRDVDRGTTWVTVTSSAGLYDFPEIPVGNVQVKAEAAGFSTEVRNSFTLALNQVAKVDFQMKVGKVSDTVTVTDAPPLLQTSSTEVGTVIDANAVSSLPMASRDRKSVV